MAVRKLLAVVALLSVLPVAGCGSLAARLSPSATPAPALTQTASPAPVPVTATPLPTPAPPALIPTRTPFQAKGEIFFTIAGSNPARSRQALAALPAGCLDCPAPVVGTALLNPSGAPLPLAWSHDGNYAAYASALQPGGMAALRLFRVAGGDNWKTLAELAILGPQVFWSADDQWIAFQGQEKDRPDIYIIHPDGSGLKNLTRGSLAGMTRVVLGGWVGDKVLFSGSNSQGNYAYTVSAAAPIPRRASGLPIFRGYGPGFPTPAPSPDGKWLAYTEITPITGQSLYVLSLEKELTGRVLANFKDGAITGFSWSPGSDWLALWLTIDQTSQVYLVRPDGADLHLAYSSTTGIRAVIFAPHGEDLLLVETAGPGPSRLLLVPLGFGQPETLRAPGLGMDDSWEGSSWRP